MLESNPNSKLENKYQLTLAKAREILKDEMIEDEKLNEIIDCVNIFCRISYELYSQQESLQQAA